MQRVVASRRRCKTSDRMTKTGIQDDSAAVGVDSSEAAKLEVAANGYTHNRQGRRLGRENSAATQDR